MTRKTTDHGCQELRLPRFVRHVRPVRQVIKCGSMLESGIATPEEPSRHANLYRFLYRFLSAEKFMNNFSASRIADILPPDYNIQMNDLR